MKGARFLGPVPKGAKKKTAAKTVALPKAAKKGARGAKKPKPAKDPTPAKGRGKKAPKSAEQGPFSQAGKLARLRTLAAEINKRLKNAGCVAVGKDIQELEYQYIRTGNPAFDFVTNGGLIRGRITELWGIDGTSKTTFLAQTFRHLQSQGHVCALAPIEGMDKGWWRTNGVYIPYGAKEIAKLDAKERKKAERYNDRYQALGWAPLTVIQTKAGDQALQIVYELVKRNVVDVIGIDSLGAVKRSRILEEKDLTNPSEHGGEASLFSNFCDFLYSAQNTRYDDDGNPDPLGTHANKTVVVCINQARVTMGTMAYAEHKRYHPKGGQALRHAWSQSVFFRDLNDDLTRPIKLDSYDRKQIYAKAFEIFGYKMRGGPEGRTGRYTLYISNHVDKDGTFFKAGTLDAASSLRALAVQLGLIAQQGAWYSIPEGEHAGRWNGKDAFDSAIRDDEDLYEHLYEAVLERAKNDSLASVVPDVD